MRPLKVALSAALVTLALAAASAQTRAPENRPTPQPCPTVTVSCPDPSKPGDPITYTASVTGGDPGVTPTFNWTVSAGTITSGQGTSEITVKPAGVTGGETAVVEVGGYDRSCETSSSCTTNICRLPLQPRKVDEYGPVSLGDEKERLNNSFVELQNDPTAQGYLICYGGRRSRAGEARRRCERAREYLVPTRGIDASRVVIVDGGLREVPTTEFWLVPSGAEPPQASPTFFPKGRDRR